MKAYSYFYDSMFLQVFFFKHPICMRTQKFKLCLVTRQLYEDDNVLTEIISIIVNFTNEKDSNFKFGTDL